FQPSRAHPNPYSVPTRRSSDLYALHDGLVKPMPGKPQAGSLAESWSVSPDGLSYEFVLRQGVRFHNGDPLTAELVAQSVRRDARSEEHTSELQSRVDLVCRLLT